MAADGTTQLRVSNKLAASSQTNLQPAHERQVPRKK